jgi:nitrogen-specific signal transduction histidine kinase
LKETGGEEFTVERLAELHHEINNALVGVRGHAQLLLHGVGDQPRARERLEVILRESARIEKAVRQIRELQDRDGDRDPHRV